MLSQLIYLSYRTEKCTNDEIDKILTISIKKNETKNVTGILLYSDTIFIQVLEGQKDEILAIYDKIKQDPRHTKVVMISLRTIQNRYFPSWQMGSKKFDTESYEFISKMDNESAKQFKELLNGDTKINAIDIIKKFYN